MVLVIHDFSDKTIRFEKDKIIIWRGLAHEFTDDIAVQIIKHCGKKNINSIWNVRLWKLYQLYTMFIDKHESKITFDNDIMIDEENKINYILVIDFENIELDNEYENILLLYAPYGLSSTLENKIIESDLTIHFLTV